MTDRFEKSMQTLELPRVLDMLADQAVTEEGKDKARRLRPETDPVEVTALLAETTAAVEKMVLGGSPAFAGITHITKRCGLQSDMRPHRFALLFRLLS